MKFHLLSLPHTQVTADYLTCAYTQKVRKFVQMMEGHHEVILYAGEECDVNPTEFVSCISEEVRAHYFGDGFDTVRSPLEWDSSLPYWGAFHATASCELGKRVEKGDFVLLTTSASLPAISTDVRDKAIIVEWAVGYEGVRSPFAIFESYAWMHHVYGLMGIRNGRAYDDVVPNFFNEEDFYTDAKGDYLMFLGRMIQRKGPHVASLIAERVDMPIVYAGPGADAVGTDIVCDDGTECVGVYKGEADAEERAQLLSQAYALIVPTLYVEPFGGVACEAMLSGTPVIASDWGAFTETVPEVAGRRFRTLAEGCAAVEEVGRLDPWKIREYARANYSLEAVRPRFERAFERYSTLWHEGWYA